MYLEQKRKNNTESHEQWIEKLISWHSCEAEWSRILLARGKSTTADNRCCESAKKFLREHDLHSWLNVVNVNQGLAPGSQTVLQKLRARNLSCEPAAQVCRTTLKKQKLQWLRRWRRKWGVKIGKLNQRDHLSKTELKQKAFVL